MQMQAEVSAPVAAFVPAGRVAVLPRGRAVARGANRCARPRPRAAQCRTWRAVASGGTNDEKEKKGDGDGKDAEEEGSADAWAAAAFGSGDAAAQLLTGLRRLTAEETTLSNGDGLRMSHELVKLDDFGDGPRERYVYVEERDCIGCTHCQTTADATFFMEPEWGRARVFDQTGDLEPVVEEAIDTCPVNCIYYVSWDDLVTLEKERRDAYINNWARLVGGQDISSSRAPERKTTVMDSAIMRCGNCPANGCKACPMYGVGENPEYKKRVQARKERVAKRRKAKQQNKRQRRKI